MDESFHLRSRKPLDGGEPAPLDHELLSAALIAQQATSPAACAQARAEQAQAPTGIADPLTELLLAGPAWPRAASAQSGCFNRAESKRRLNLR